MSDPQRHLIGYACPKAPDGPLIPPHALYDPCGQDVAVYSDGTTDPPKRRAAMSERPLDVVNEQAEDDGLWFVAQTTPEAYLQQGLRRLHAAVKAAHPGRTKHSGWVIHKASRSYDGGIGYTGPSWERAGLAVPTGPFAVRAAAEAAVLALDTVNPVGWVIAEYIDEGPR